MKTLTSSASNIIIDKYNNDRGFLSSKGFHVNKPESLFWPSKKLVNACFLQHRAVPLLPISFISFCRPRNSDAQAELDTGAQFPTAYESKTVHVKFQLQKECLFGEQFFLVGDDPILGLWDPISAIPLDWSDEHIWSVELDVPVGKTFHFKFILRECTDDIVWQPGPDRIFQTWETKNTIMVFEDWEDAEEQKIIEEDPAVISKMLVAHNFTQPEEAPVSNIDNNPLAVDSNIDSAKLPEKPMAIVAENIGCPKEDPVSTANNKMLGEKQISQPDEESAANKNTKTEEDVLRRNDSTATINNLAAENTGYPKDNPVSEASNKIFGVQPEEESLASKNMMTEAVIGNNGSAATIKDLASTDVEGNLITHEGDAVLVPGSTPLPTSDEGEIQDEDRKSISVDASVGINEAMNYNLPELDEKQEHKGDQCEEKKTDIFNMEVQQLDEELKQTPHLSGHEQQPDANSLESNIVQNDIHWGRRTLQTLLTNLGLL